jgi:hypothetical protein
MTTAADVLLVGSVPLSSPEEVMRACGSGLGDVVMGIPDGETGDRTLWVVYQAYRVFHEHPQLETLRRPVAVEGEEQWMPAGVEDLWSFGIRADAGELRFDDLKYASVAEVSYGIFRQLRDEGAIAPGVRFQVSLPLPESAVSWFFQDPALIARVLPAYEEALVRELDRISAAIPAKDLALQWDVCWEVLDQEGIFPWAMPKDPPPIQRFRDTIGRLSPHIPGDALLGYHLCYADLGHQHMKEPEDLALCVQMANIAASDSGRRVDYIHMPVPRARDDDAYFEPLSRLNIGDTKLFLGLVHHTDGIEGTRRRLTTAKRHLDRFGIATECGFGRRPAEQVSTLLDIHKTIAGDLEASV